jgi:hypothetical protein
MMAMVRKLRGACGVGVAVLMAAGATAVGGSAQPQPAAPPAEFPTVPTEHRHVRALLGNALRYVAPEHGMIDPVSGYPFEGWNHDPKQKLFLRSFTQLTAIGQWMEVLGNVAAGHAETPHLSRDQALARLTHLVGSVRQDQRDPQLSAKGLLGNFLDLASGRRLGPLANEVEREKFVATFGPEKGEAIWKALEARGWIEPRRDGREAAIKRGSEYGADRFVGALAPFRDAATRQKVMEILDRRVVLVVFGDNANLSASAAKTIGALLHPSIKDRPEAVAIRRELEQFLDDQRAGYAHLYDPKAGLFYFGWDATRGRLFGWLDAEGRWKTGHMDYLVNEFRAPATFVVLRYGLPVDAVKNLGFKMKPYRMRDGREVHSLAPWEGSAFQVLGLGLWLNELRSPSWRTLLTNAVEIEIDCAGRHRLPGFLSESYTGVGAQYTGYIGIPEITVSPRPRITDAASLYTLGTAYPVAPEQVERFLGANWPVVGKLLTEHGPWEGYNITRKEAIRFQTTAHTLSLVLGFLGQGSEQMTRYLDSRGLSGRLAEIYRPGEAVDLLAEEARVFAWAPKEGGGVRSGREKGAFRVRGERAGQVGIAFVPPGGGANLSGGLLSVRYRSGTAGPAVIDLKPAGDVPADAGLIPTQLFTRLADTGGREEEVRIPLPATPGLTEIKEAVLTFRPEAEGGPIDLTVTRLGTTPMGPP